MRIDSRDDGHRSVLILFGPPASGKGTHGQKIANQLEMPLLSTGDMLRDAAASGTLHGISASDTMRSGGLVSDDMIVRILQDRIRLSDCGAGFILDGFPRTVTQAQLLDRILAESGGHVHCVLALEVSEAELKDRICGRWVHPSSGRIYHATRAPPRSLPEGQTPSDTNMRDNETGQPLVQREDDTEEALARRLEIYREQTAPVLQHYRPKVRHVDASGVPSVAWPKVSAAVFGHDASTMSKF